MLETLKTGQSAHVIFEHPSADGHLMYSDLITYPVKDPRAKSCRSSKYGAISPKSLSRLGKKNGSAQSDINKLVQEDRMISLGKLVASCVHEINNPIQGC